MKHPYIYVAIMTNKQTKGDRKMTIKEYQSKIFETAEDPKFVKVCAGLCGELNIMTANEWNNNTDNKKIVFLLSQAKKVVDIEQMINRESQAN